MAAAAPLPNDSEPLPSTAAVESALPTVPPQETTVSAIKEAPLRDPHQRHDFRQSTFLAAGEMRKLRQWHEELIRSLAARLSMYLRLEVTLQLTKLHALPFQKWTEALSDPTYLTLFKAEPLRGICILDVPPRLGLTFVDRLLGGQARSVNLQRPLSEIETALLEQVVQIMLTEWCQHWNGAPDLRPILLGHETNGRFLQTSPRETMMCAVEIEVHIGDCMEHIQLVLPCSTLESLIGRLPTIQDTGAKEKAPANPPPLKWNRQLEEIKIAVVAQCLGVKMTLRQASELKVGDLVPLPPETVNQVEIRFASSPKFVGRLGTRDHHWAIEMTHALKS